MAIFKKTDIASGCLIALKFANDIWGDGFAIYVANVHLSTNIFQFVVLAPLLFPHG